MISTTVTIFIRVRNEARDLPRCLEQLANQEGEGITREIVVLDCESEDGSPDIARSFGAKVFSISPQMFSYSRALQFGVAKSTGEFFLPLSGHVVPLDGLWLQNLLAPLLRDAAISASYSRQLLSADASSIEHRACQLTFPEKSRTLALVDMQDTHVDSLYERLVFSNASSCYRRSVVSKHPFREIPFAEDRLWAWEALLRGEKLAYAADSRCEHYHPPDFGAFRSLSRRATVSKYLIERFVSEKLGCPWGEPGALREFLMYLRVPLAALMVAGVVSLRPFLRSGKAIPFFAASIGTTLGKAEGVREFRKNSALPIPFADERALLDGAKS